VQENIAQLRTGTNATCPKPNKRKCKCTKKIKIIIKKYFSKMEN
jgi:hypothetical protein